MDYDFDTFLGNCYERCYSNDYEYYLLKNYYNRIIGNSASKNNNTSKPNKYIDTQEQIIIKLTNLIDIRKDILLFITMNNLECISYPYTNDTMNYNYNSEDICLIINTLYQLLHDKINGLYDSFLWLVAKILFEENIYSYQLIDWNNTNFNETEIAIITDRLKRLWRYRNDNLTFIDYIIAFFTAIIDLINVFTFGLIDIIYNLFVKPFDIDSIENIFNDNSIQKPTFLNSKFIENNKYYKKK